jgi:hypothetical protein
MYLVKYLRNDLVYPVGAWLVGVAFLPLVTLVSLGSWNKAAYGAAVTPVVGATLGNAIFNPAVGFNTGPHSLAFGGGVLIDSRLAKKLEIELGLLYLPRGYTRLPTNLTNTETTLTAFQGSALIKTRLLPFFTLGAGAYYSRGMGAISIANTTTGTVITEEYGVLIKTEDYGLLAAVGIHIGTISYLDIAVHGRYLWGLQNSSAVAGTTLTLNDLQILTGIRFNF